MPRLNADKLTEREYQINIIVGETGECRVIAIERNNPQARASAATPLSGILGLRECFRLGRLMVTQFHNTKQRALDLRAKADALAERQRAAPPRPQRPKLTLAPITGPLVDTLPEDENGAAVADILARRVLEASIADDLVAKAEQYVGPLSEEEKQTVNQIAAEHVATLEELQAPLRNPTVAEFETRLTAAGHPVVVVDLDEDDDEPATAEAPPWAREVLADVLAENSRGDVLISETLEVSLADIPSQDDMPAWAWGKAIEITSEAQLDALEQAKAPSQGKTPGIDSCLSCEGELTVRNNESVCLNPDCDFYDPGNGGETTAAAPPLPKRPARRSRAKPRGGTAPI